MVAPPCVYRRATTPSGECPNYPNLNIPRGEHQQRMPNGKTRRVWVSDDQSAWGTLVYTYIPYEHGTRISHRGRRVDPRTIVVSA
jgi:hypothetical protein